MPAATAFFSVPTSRTCRPAPFRPPPRARDPFSAVFVPHLRCGINRAESGRKRSPSSLPPADGGASPWSAHTSPAPHGAGWRGHAGRHRLPTAHPPRTAPSLPSEAPAPCGRRGMDRAGYKGAAAPHPQAPARFRCPRQWPSGRNIWCGGRVDTDTGAPQGASVFSLRHIFTSMRPARPTHIQGATILPPLNLPPRHQHTRRPPRRVSPRNLSTGPRTEPPFPPWSHPSLRSGIGSRAGKAPPGPPRATGLTGELRPPARVARPRRAALFSPHGRFLFPPSLTRIADTGCHRPFSR